MAKFAPYYDEVEGEFALKNAFIFARVQIKIQSRFSVTVFIIGVNIIFALI